MQNDDVFPFLGAFEVPEGRVSRLWLEVRKIANIEDVRIHDLRHTFASYAVMEGYPIAMVAKLLGHKRISSTLRYTHVGDGHIEKEAQKIGDVLQKITSEQPPKPKKCGRPRKVDTERVSTKINAKLKSTQKVEKKREAENANSLSQEQIRRYQDDIDFLS
ncbi:tyrosine-type recombinase/integrase [Vibrio mediterranei]